MNFIYMPFAEEPYEACDPRPDTGFVMMHFGVENLPNDPTSRSAVEATRRLLKNAQPFADRDFPRIMDGIFSKIHGCGFVIAIVSENTPRRTIGSIFFELGIAAVLGKPAMIVWSGKDRDDVIPSDLAGVFVPQFQTENPKMFKREVDKFKQANKRRRRRLLEKAQILSERNEEKDLLLSFEYLKRAFLIEEDDETRDAINQILSSLHDCEKRDAELREILEKTRNLLNNIDILLKNIRTTLKGKNKKKHIEELELIRGSIIEMSGKLADERFGRSYRNPDSILRRRLKEAIRQFLFADEYYRQARID